MKITTVKKRSFAVPFGGHISDFENFKFENVLEKIKFTVSLCHVDQRKGC